MRRASVSTVLTLLVTASSAFVATPGQASTAKEKTESSIRPDTPAGKNPKNNEFPAKPAKGPKADAKKSEGTGTSGGGKADHSDPCLVDSDMPGCTKAKSK